METFSPELKIIGGIAIVAVGLFTLVNRSFPIIWIGGFILGISLIVNGYNQYTTISELDNAAKPAEPNEPKPNKPKPAPNSITITCGRCSTKIYVKKGLGVSVVKCPYCHGEYTVKS